MHAIIKTGGKQYRVQAEDTIFIEKLNATYVYILMLTKINTYIEIKLRRL